MVSSSVFSASLFRHFNCEYCYRDETLGDLSLADFLSELGRSIETKLDHLARIVRVLVSRDEWKCSWDGDSFHLCSSLMPQAASNCLYQGFREANLLFPSQPKRPTDFHSGENYKRRYYPQGGVKFRILNLFDIEMELSGIRLMQTLYAGSEPPLTDWPARDFDLASHLSGLGERINLRLRTFACFFREFMKGKDSWNFIAIDDSLLLLSPESLAGFECIIQRFDLSPNRVELLTADEAMQQVAAEYGEESKIWASSP